MRGTTMDGVTDWVEFDDPDYDIRYNVHLTFMLSNYNCIWGRGCPGMFTIQDTKLSTECGCCTGGFYVRDKDELDKMERMIDQLTDDDWDSTLRKYVTKHGWKARVASNYAEDDANFKSKVYEHACVFNNRNNGSAGKPGCAFHHLAQRTGQHFADTKPYVCWTMPLRFDEEVLDDDSSIVTVRPWDADDWGADQYDEEDSDKVMRWWCTDTPDAYTGSLPVFLSMEAEIRRAIGDKSYDILADLCRKRTGVVEPMPGAVTNDGRPLLPLLIGNRQPRRAAPSERGQ